jgi:hypothetical protein
MTITKGGRNTGIAAFLRTLKQKQNKMAIKKTPYNSSCKTFIQNIP